MIPDFFHTRINHYHPDNLIYNQMAGHRRFPVDGDDEENTDQEGINWTPVITGAENLLVTLFSKPGQPPPNNSYKPPVQTPQPPAPAKSNPLALAGIGLVGLLVITIVTVVILNDK